MEKVFICLALLIVIVVNSGCPGKPCIESNYSFAAQARFSPQKDSINIGDTLYLSCTMPTKLKDLRTGIEINYSNAKVIGSTLVITELPITDTLIRDAVSAFSYFSIKGLIYNSKNIPSPERVQQLSFLETTENYELKVGLIPKKKGTYMLGIGNGISTGLKRSRDCNKAGFDLTINNDDQHLYLFSLWRPGQQLSEYERNRAYCIKVN